MKNIKLKKLTSILVAFILVCSLSLSAWAEANPDTAEGVESSTSQDVQANSNEAEAAAEAEASEKAATAEESSGCSCPNCCKGSRQKGFGRRQAPDTLPDGMTEEEAGQFFKDRKSFHGREKNNSEMLPDSETNDSVEDENDIAPDSFGFHRGIHKEHGRGDFRSFSKPQK